MEQMKWIAHAMVTNFSVQMVDALKIDSDVVSTNTEFYMRNITRKNYWFNCILLWIDGWSDCLDGSDEAIELCAGAYNKYKYKYKSILLKL